MANSVHETHNYTVIFVLDPKAVAIKSESIEYANQNNSARVTRTIFGRFKFDKSNLV